MCNSFNFFINIDYYSWIQYYVQILYDNEGRMISKGSFYDTEFVWMFHLDEMYTVQAIEFQMITSLLGVCIF